MHPSDGWYIYLLSAFKCYWFSQQFDCYHPIKAAIISHYQALVMDQQAAYYLHTWQPLVDSNVRLTLVEGRAVKASLISGKLKFFNP